MSRDGCLAHLYRNYKKIQKKIKKFSKKEGFLKIM